MSVIPKLSEARPIVAGHVTETAFLSATDLVEAFGAGTLSPVEAVEASLNRILTHDKAINAFTLIDADAARSAARDSEKRWRSNTPLGLLDGVPLSVKDTLSVKGYPFRRGSRAASDKPAEENAPSVQRAFNHGAIFIGITTTPEFGCGPVTNSPLTGITRNPWDTSKTSGGSSGGAAASIAAGMGHLALGTDAGGSIRIPSGLCGVVGMKPTGGIVASYPISVAGNLATSGPIARNVRDAALLLSAIAGPDPRDFDSHPAGEADYLVGLDDGVAGMRIAFSPTLGYAQKLDPEVRDRVYAAVQLLGTLGAEIEEVDPGFDNPIKAYVDLFHSGTAFALRNFSSDQHKLLSDTVRSAVAAGANVTLTDYLHAQEVRRNLVRKMAEFHERFDLLVTPTVAVPAFTADRSTPEDFASFPDMRAWTPFCYPFNLTQQPAISVPCGLTASGLPVGLHIIGPRYHDRDVMRAAYAYERNRPSVTLPNLPAFDD